MPPAIAMAPQRPARPERSASGKAEATRDEVETGAGVTATGAAHTFQRKLSGPAGATVIARSAQGRDSDAAATALQVFGEASSYARASAPTCTCLRTISIAVSSACS